MRGSFIDGRWQSIDSPDGVFVRNNPSHTSEMLYEMPWSVAPVDAAVAAARAAQPGWDALGQEARIEVLQRFAKALQKREDELATAIALQAGKPVWEARGEARALAAKIEIMTGEGAQITRPVHPQGAGGYWVYRPLGVVAVLGPFNFPLHLPNGHVIPALATGNTVVIKPSELTSQCMEIYIEAAQEADFPPGVINLVHGPGEVGAALVEHRGIDVVAFTGSYATGLRIKRATLEQHWKLLALEMGGKNTSIVLEDADLDQTINEVLYAAFMTTGQRCSATSRLVVQSSIFDEVVDALVAKTRRVTTGHVLDEECFMGPLIDKGSYARFIEAQSEDESGTLVPLLEGGPAREDLDGYYVKPAIWHATEFDPEGAHQAEELFGPDLVLYRVDDDARAVEIANGTDFGLAMSVFTADETRYETLARRLRSGIVNLNRSTCGASSRLPFGGLGKSGNHRPAAILAGLYVTYPQARLIEASGWDATREDSQPWSLLS